jgi:hypothetical protein
MTIYFGIASSDLAPWADLVTIIVALIALITYAALRLISRKGIYGLTDVMFAPPQVSESAFTAIKNVENRESAGLEHTYSFANGQELCRYLVSPIIVIIPCVLVNTDIFPETLTGASLTIQNLDTKNTFELQVRRMSQTLSVSQRRDGRTVLHDSTFFTEQILNRGTEKRYNLFFHKDLTYRSTEKRIVDAEGALLGDLAPGKYNLTLVLKKKKFWSSQEIVNMEFDILRIHQDLFWDCDPYVMSIGEENGLRILPPKKWYYFWKKQQQS